MQPIASRRAASRLVALLLIVLPLSAPAQVPEHLSLAEALDVASQQSPTLLAERLRAEEARGALVEARALAPANPWLSVAGAPWIATADGGELPWEFEVEQRLEVPGLRAARISAASADLGGAQAGALDVERVLLSAVAAAYYDAVGAAERASIATEDEILAASVLAIARVRVERGADAPIALGVARIRHAEAGRAALAANAEQRASVLRLAALLGLSADDIVLSSALPSAPTISLDSEVLFTRALERRPDLRALDRALEAADAELKLARRQSLPGLTAGARYEALDGEGVALALVGVEVPFFRWNQGDRIAASAHLQRLREERAALVFSIEAEVRTAWLRWEAAAESVALYDETVVTAMDENLGLLTTMFDAGKVGYGDVATFQRERLAGALGFVEARMALAHSEVALLSAAGAPLVTDTQNGGAQ